MFPFLVRWHMASNMIKVFGASSRVKILSEIFKMAELNQEVYIRKLVQITGLTSQTVTNHIADLEDDGIITRVQIEGAPTKFIHIQSDLRDILKELEGLA